MNFTRKGVKKKQRELVAKMPRTIYGFSVSGFKALLVLVMALVIFGIGAGFGSLKGLLDSTPEINATDLIPTGFHTTLYNQDGDVVQVLANFDSNREYVYYDEIPEDLVNAFVSIEDERFWTHNGIDLQGIGRAFLLGLTTGEFDQGASTITQQLIKNQIYNVGLDEKTFMDKLERKVQEQYLAVEIEKVLDKESIIEYYLNTIYLAQSRYGVQTAAEYYFNKDLSELTVSECAVIAAIPQNPTKYDPIKYPEENATRRLNVLNKMLELEYITQAEYDAALADNVYDRIAKIDQARIETSDDVYTYYVDEVINQLESDFMEMGYTKSEADNLIYSGGLDVYICQDQAIQDICDEILNDESDYPTGEYLMSWALTLVDDDQNQYNYSSNMMVKWFQEEQGQSKFDLIFSTVEDARAAADEYKAYLLESTGYEEYLESFSTVIQPQISYTIMDQSNGQVKAIVGGRGEKTENRSFNRATEATRQPGSTFKVLAAFLPAIDGCGMGLGTVYVDEAYEYANGVTVNNWYSGYRGACTIRTAIMNSMNIIAVKTITDVTPQLAYEYLLKLGFTTLVESRTTSSGTIESDINQSLALGGLTDGVTNLEITAAFATIANSGNYIKPVFYTVVYDHDGNILIDNRNPEKTQVITEQTAWLLTQAMHDVVTSGTGTKANVSGVYVAGKTGTTSSNYDVWFCGYTPYYTASIWMGYDTNTDFTHNNMHKVLWRKIMTAIVELEEQDSSATFEQPDGIVSVTVCSQTGLLPGSGCPTTTDYFAKGHEPTSICAGGATLLLCDDTHMLATNTCPHTTEYSYYYDEDGNITFSSDVTFVFNETMLQTECSLHPAEEEEAEEEEEEESSGKKKYTITTMCDSGGSISPTTKVKSGGSTTIYITPSSGYYITDVLVDGISMGSITSYTFTDVSEEHIVYAAFAESGGGTITEASTKATTEATTEATTQATTEATTTEATTEATATE